MLVSLSASAGGGPASSGTPSAAPPSAGRQRAQFGDLEGHEAARARDAEQGEAVMQQSSEPGDDRPILLHLEGASTSKVQGSLPGWHEAPIALRRAGWGAGAGDARGGWGGGGWAAPGRRGDRCARAAHRDDAVTNPLIVRRLPGRGLVRGHSQKVRLSHVQGC